MQVENEDCFSSEIYQKTRDNEKEKQDDVLDQVNKKLKDINGEQKSLLPNPNQKDQGVNPEKFNGPGQKPKTANKAFGDISDFLLFFENRNLEIKEFVNEFKEIEKLDSEFSIGMLNTVIVPKIDKCLNEMHQKIKIKTKSILKRRNKYAGLFSSLFTSWGDFYKQLLLAYTINGFLYQKMNKYLRNENWIDLDTLLPYTYSLFRAFQWRPVGLVQENFEALKRKCINNKLILYRRADFDDHSLRFYDANKRKNFSWNGVISTSLDPEITKKFQGDSSKRPILIIIEIEFENLQPESLNALYLAEYSAYPQEEEVTLPPGSIFELLEINKEKPEVEMRLRLMTSAKILAHKGQFMHGMLQSLMRHKENIKIVCLNGKDLSRAIDHCKGNLLIENLEFILCDFNHKAAKVLLEVLPTIKNLASLTLNLVILGANCNVDNILECLGKLKIKSLEFLTSLHENQVESILNNMRYLGSLRKIKLTFAKPFQHLEEFIRRMSDARIQYLHPECLFELKVSDHLSLVLKQFSDNSFNGDLKRILTSQNQNNKDIFEGNLRVFNEVLSSKQKREMSFPDENISSRDLKSQNAGEQKPRNLSTEIRINYKRDALRKTFAILQIKNPVFDEQIGESWGNEDLDSLLKEGLRSINLTALSFDFSSCSQESQVDDASLKFLAGIPFLESLTVLSLNFAGCDKITDDASFDFLWGIKNLRLLTDLHLNFQSCEKLTDNGLFFLQEVQYLQSLSTLYLNFAECKGITDKGLKFLQGIRYLKSLTVLHLNFNKCYRITDHGLKSLNTEISHFEFLKVLILKFYSCQKISKAEVDHLTRSLKKNLKSGVELHLGFDHFESSECQSGRQVKDGDTFYLSKLENWKKTFVFDSHPHFDLSSGNQSDFSVICDLSSGVLNFKARYLSNNPKDLPTYIFDRNQLENLEKVRRLNLKCPNNFNMKELTDQVIKHFSTLTDLCIDLRRCVNTTDSHFKTLFHDGLQYVQFLEILHLDFGGYFQTTEEVLKFIDWNSISHLKLLRSLSLNFSQCLQITDESLRIILNEGIQNLKSLTSLHLNFDGCSKITNDGLEFVGLNIIRHLEFLKNLYLSFNGCNEVTDKGLHILCNGAICHLKSLENLFLYIPSAGIVEEFEGETLKSDLLASCAIIIQNRIEKKNVEGFNLRRSNKKHDENSINKRTAIDITCFKKPSYKYKEKYYIFNEETLDLLRSDQGSFEEEGEEWIESQEFKLDSSKEKRKALQLTFSLCGDVINFLLNNLFFKRMDTLKSLLILNLSFYRCRDIKDDELESFACQGIQYLKSLHTLQLSFDGCYLMTDKGLKSLCCKGVWEIDSLTNLKLAFDRCGNITDEGIKEMFQNNLSLGLLNTLCLSFRECSKITDKGLGNLCHEGIQNLKSLQALNLQFEGQESITNEGLTILSQQGLQQAKSLATLNLSFIGCHNITKRGLEILLGKGIRYLKALVTLNLNFEDCYKITDDEFESFYYELLIECPSSHTSQSSLSGCKLSLQPTFSIEHSETSTETEIVCADKFWFYLSETPLEIEESLARLLKFRLKSDQNLKQDSFLEEKRQETSESLILKFENGWNITEDLPQKLNFDKWVIFEKLETFHFLFDGCHQMRAEDLGFFSFCQSVRRFQSIVTLHLSFYECLQMTDEGIRNLCVQGIRHLKLLVNLHLNFKECQKITDKGMQILFYEGLDYLELLEALSLNFDGSNRITDNGFQSFCHEGIPRLKSLKSLDLNFNVCDGISDEGLLALCCHAIKDLDSLTSFQFVFKNGDQITEKGLKDLILEGMPRLLKLENIQLSFPQTLKVSSNIYQAFHRILFYFGFESSSDLN